MPTQPTPISLARAPRRTARRSPLRAIIALAVATSVFAAPVSASAKPKPKPKGCTAGDIKTDKNGDKYVCDTHGKWIWVLDLTTGASGTVVATTGEPTAVRAQANGSGSGGGGVTCETGNPQVPAKPGEIIELIEYTKDSSGTVQHIKRTKKICGSDGQWHTVARTISNPPITVLFATTYATEVL